MRKLISVVAVLLVVMFGAAFIPLSTASGAIANGPLAGYSATSQAAFASASEKFRVPTVRCEPIGAVTEFGSFLLSYNKNWAAAVAIACADTGSPSYLLQYGFQYSHFAPKPGDLILTRVSMSRTGPQATLDDVTQAVSVSSSAGGGRYPVVAWDGIQPICILGPGCGTTVVDFGKLRIFGATIDGVTPKAAAAVAFDTYQVATSATNATGNAWTEVFSGTP